MVQKETDDSSKMIWCKTVTKNSSKKIWRKQDDPKDDTTSQRYDKVVREESQRTNPGSPRQLQGWPKTMKYLCKREISSLTVRQLQSLGWSHYSSFQIDQFRG